MSRCFPFPPPGYEKRARTDDTDLLTKEKHKEKKHKKDKKDKEKREGKEKKDKERSKDKHKEKKDRKEKHKEKKDKDRDKDKNLSSPEKKAEKQPERSNGENAAPDSRQNVEIKDSKYVQELSRRIRDEDRATGSQMAQNAVTDQKRATLLDRVAASNIANKFREGEKIKDEKTINGFRNHVVDPRVLENEVVRKSSGDGKAAKAVDQNNVEKKMEAKEKSEKHKNRDKEKRSKSKDKDRNREKEKKEKVKKTKESKEQPKLKEGVKDMTGISVVKPSNHLLKGDTKVSVEGNLGVLKEVEIKKELTKEQPKLKENSKLSPCGFVLEPSSRLKEETKNSSIDGILGKRKELETKKEPTSKDIISKVVPVISNVKLSNHVKEDTRSSDGVGDLGKRKELVISNVKLSNHVKEDTRSSNGVGDLGKRKELEMNWILNDNGVRPNKSQRLVSPIHPVMENGRKTEPCQIPEQVKPERQGGGANNLKVEIKGHRINGMSDAQVPKRPSQASANVQMNENGELCGKPPHPDSKYLNQILSLPKIEESLDHDNQDWLFSCKKPKKPKSASPEDRTTSQVWAQSLKIESADVYALPYVIPY